jgi:hypothetical protein
MATFLLTGHLLQWVNTMVINPDLDIFPSYIGFQDEDVKKYGYLLLFVMNFPHYAYAIWDPKSADFPVFLPQPARAILIPRGVTEIPSDLEGGCLYQAPSLHSIYDWRRICRVSLIFPWLFKEYLLLLYCSPKVHSCDLMIQFEI